LDSRVCPLTPSVGAGPIRSIPALKPFVLSVAIALSLLVATPNPAAAARPCWKDVVQDWFTNEKIDYSYHPQCYRQAIKHLPPVTESYSSARDDIRRALLAALSNPTGPSAPTTPDTKGGLNKDSGGGGFLSDLLAKLGPSNADAIPLPLLILAGISLLLLGTAGASFIARRVQARRVEVAPVSARPNEQS
jgi:hypothetical protein